MPLTPCYSTILTGKRVLVTGHTGFTGSWICLWLEKLGIDVFGYSLSPETKPSMYLATNAGAQIDSAVGDICDAHTLQKAVQRYRPDLILHLAAQPLVRRSYLDPARTFEVNCQGTVNVLEAARASASVTGVLCITTDKVYANKEWLWPYRENDALGGSDPYSASKAAAELAIRSFKASFPHSEGKGPAVAVARGGNIIGGGDWSEDRLIPDFVRSVVNDVPLRLRYPDAIRPWQHVLALVEGYLKILAGLAGNSVEVFARPWNLGPVDPLNYSVREVLEILGSNWIKPGLEFDLCPLPESGRLTLDSSLAIEKLGWNPSWDTKTSLKKTADWYREYYRNPADARAISLDQIEQWSCSGYD